MRPFIWSTRYNDRCWGLIKRELKSYWERIVRCGNLINKVISVCSAWRLGRESKCELSSYMFKLAQKYVYSASLIRVETTGSIIYRAVCTADHYVRWVFKEESKSRLENIAQGWPRLDNGVCLNISTYHSISLGESWQKICSSTSHKLWVTPILLLDYMLIASQVVDRSTYIALQEN